MAMRIRFSGWRDVDETAFSVQKILGHTTMEMTRNYVNMLSDHLVEQHRLHSPMDRLQDERPAGKEESGRT
jgi:hypothetical protein